MVRLVPNVDSVPAEVLPYLLRSERQVITVRQHPTALVPSVSLPVADVTAFVLGAVDVIPGGFVMLVILGTLFAPSCYFFYRRLFVWMRTWFVFTSVRLIRIGWKGKVQLTVIPIKEAGAMSYIRSLPGRVIGYGSFVLRVPDPDGHLRKIKFLPYPDLLYLELLGSIFSDDYRAD